MKKIKNIWNQSIINAKYPKLKNFAIVSMSNNKLLSELENKNNKK